MQRYYSTFIPGFSEVVKDIIKCYINDVEIELLLDGLIVYKTSISIEQIKEIPFFNNSFLVLHFFKEIEPGSLANMAKFVYQSNFLKRITLPSFQTHPQTFRVIISKENKQEDIDKNILKNIEEKIAKEFGLKLERGKPDIEFWFLERSEGIGFFALRLTHKGKVLSNLKPGELRPELATLLCLLSSPQKEDIFLDPFSGWGSIPLARKQFPYTNILAFDIDKEKVERLKSLNLEAQVHDVSELNNLDNNSIDVIVTDPPWGLAEKVDVESLYQQMLNQFERILKNDGRIIVLTAKKLIFEKLLLNYQKLNLVKKYDVLVNGKKAGVYKLTRQLSY